MPICQESLVNRALHCHTPPVQPWTQSAAYWCEVREYQPRQCFEYVWTHHREKRPVAAKPYPVSQGCYVK